jgi:glycosyltransferase involved in cell wall biosynthesis
MADVVLVQPRPGGRISGGYLYNAHMARHGAWRLCEVDAGGLAAALARPPAGGLLLADSIWLTEATFAPFLDAAARGRRVGVLLHAFPSMVAAAERGAPSNGPTAFEVEALERVGLALAPGPYCAELLAGRAVDVAIAEPGVGAEWRREPRPRRGPCALVSVGAVTPLKGQLDVLEALRPRAGAGDIRLRLVGDLAAAPAYARRAAELARELGGVELLGPKAPDETRAIVHASDVLVMASYAENHPLVLLEATAAGVPPVAYAAGAAARLVEHEVSGLVCPVGDRAALGRALARLVDDEGERTRMARACWERQLALPDWPTAARRARAALDIRGR